MSTPNTQTNASAVSVIPTKFSNARETYRKWEDGFDDKLNVFLTDTKDVCEDLIDSAEDAALKAITTAWDNIESFAKDALGIKDDPANPAQSETAEDSKLDAMVKYVCTNINFAIKTTLQLAEVTVGAIAFVVQKLIKMIDKLTNALVKFIRILEDCIFEEIYRIIDAIANLIPGAIDIPWLASVIDSCPQIRCFLHDAFASIVGTPVPASTEGLLNAVKSKLRGGMTDFVNDLFVDLVKEKINDFIQKAYETVESIKKKIRKAIKGYLEELLKKRPIPGPMQWMFAQHECKKVKKANIIDWIKMLQRVTTCIDGICVAVNSELKAEIDKQNESLRLGFQYWKGTEAAYDLFSLLEDDESKLELIREEHIRRTTMEDTVNNSTSGLKSASGKVTPSAKNMSSYLQTPVTSADVTGVDLMPNGETPFIKGIESLLVNVYDNLKADLIRFQGIYEAYSRWDAEYYKTDLNNKKKEINESIGSLQYPDASAADLLMANAVKIPNINFTTVQSPRDILVTNTKLKNVPPPNSAGDRIDMYTEWYGALI